MAERLGAGEPLSLDPHLAACPRCQALLDDLNAIAEAARQLFANAEPSDKVWKNIESAIREQNPIAPEARSPGC